MFPKFPSVLRVINRLDRNPPTTAQKQDAEKVRRSRLWLQLVVFDPICQLHARLMEILETFAPVFCLTKSRINKNGGKLPAEYVSKGFHQFLQIRDQPNEKTGQCSLLSYKSLREFDDL